MGIRRWIVNRLERVQRDQGPSTAWTVGVTFRDRERWTLAEDSFRLAEEGWSESRGEGYPWVATAMFERAKCLEQLGKLTEAAALAQAAAGHRRKYGDFQDPTLDQIQQFIKRLG
jgi:hypothetical protein